MLLLATSLARSLRPKGDDDFVDRLNYYYTPLMLGIAAIVVSAKQYVGQPIQCWVPPQFTASMEEYIENFCWIQNTYWLPMNENIPDDHEAREEKQIGYYQWVPFILTTEALLFTLPAMFWRILNWQTGVNLHHVINVAAELDGGDLVERDRRTEGVAQSIQNMLDLHAGFYQQRDSMGESKFSTSEPCCTRFWKRWHYYGGSYVTLLYIFVKFLYTANVVFQFFLLNTLLKSTNYYFYGFQVLWDLVRGKEWDESGHFPRVTLCDFEVRFLGNLNRYTVQCALMVNLFNEKVFAFIWCWIFLLATVTAASALFWLFNTCIITQRLGFVLKFLRIASAQDRMRRRGKSGGMGGRPIYSAPTFLYDRFVEDYLKMDGVFTLRMLSNHAGDVVTMEVVKRLWAEYRERHYLEFESPDSLRQETTLGEELAGSSFALIKQQQVSLAC